jgi:hypothetical protein
MTERLRQAEVAALLSTALAFALTALLAGAGYAVESNPAAAWLLAEIGWIGAGVLAIGVEGVLLAGWARLHTRYPRGATAAVGSIAVIGVADVLRNLWILSQVGVPESVHPRFGVAIAAVGLAVGVVLTRRRWGAQAAAYASAVRLPHRSTCRVVTLSLLVIAVAVAGIWPFVGPFAAQERVSAATGTVLDDYEDGTYPDGYSDTAGGTTGDWSRTSTAPYEGDFSLKSDNDQKAIDYSGPSGQAESFSYAINISSFSDFNNFDVRDNSDAQVIVMSIDDGSNAQVGELRVRTSGTYEDTGIVLSTSKWYQIRYENIDWANETHDLRVYDADEDLVGEATNLAFDDTPGSAIDVFRIGGLEIGSKIDYIRENSTTVSPNPQPDLAGHVRDQSGSPVPNATVKVLEYQTSNQDEIARLTKRITNPEPPTFDATRSLTGSGSVTDVDGTYAIAHTADDWDMTRWEIVGRTLVGPDDATLGQPAVTLPAGEPVVLSLWDASREATLEDTVDEDLPGRTTDGEIVIERLDAGGNVDWGKTKQTEPIAEITAIENGGTKTHEAVSIENGLSPGFYRVYPEGHPERSYTLAVAPDGNVNQLTSSIREDAENARDNLVDRAQELQDCIDNGNCAVSNTTTNETGYFELSASGSSVSEMSVIAYKAPDGMSQSSPSPGEITAYYEDQLTDAVETEEDGTITCAADVADVGSYYTDAGMEQVEVPDQDVTLRVRKVGVPEDLDLDQRACLEQDLLDELRNSSLADYAPFIRQNLDDLSTEEITRLLAQIRNGAMASERVCRENLVPPEQPSTGRRTRQYVRAVVPLRQIDNPVHSAPFPLLDYQQQ